MKDVSTWELFSRIVERITSWRYHFLAVCLVYLILAAGFAFVQRPNDEEGFHANLAYTIIEKGRIAAPIWEPAGLERFKDCDKIFYAQPPVIFLLLAAWHKILGIGILQLRFFPIVFGLIGLIAWQKFFRKIGIENKNVLFLAAFLTGTDFIYSRFAAGRPFDMSVTSMIPITLLTYLHFRQKSLSLAILLSQFCAMAAGLMHANGLIVWAEILFLILYLDRKNLRWSHLFFYCLPYVIGGIGMALFIFLGDFETFKVQFLSLVEHTGRKGIWANIWGTIRSEFLLAYGLTTDVPPVGRSLFLILFVYLFSVIYLFRLRKNAPVRLILFLLGIHFLFFTFVFTHKWPSYVMFFIPLFALAAGLAWEDFRSRPKAHFVFSLFLLLVCLMNFAANIYRYRKNDYFKKFVPDIQAIRPLLKEDETIFASPEVAFAFGMERVLHDSTLGYYSRQDRKILMVDGFYPKLWEWYRTTQPKVYEFVQYKMNNEYDLIYEGQLYKVYRKKQL